MVSSNPHLILTNYKYKNMCLQTNLQNRSLIFFIKKEKQKRKEISSQQERRWPSWRFLRVGGRRGLSGGSSLREEWQVPYLHILNANVGVPLQLNYL